MELHESKLAWHQGGSTPPSAKHTHKGGLGKTPPPRVWFADPCFPGGWQFQLMSSSTEAKRLHSEHLEGLSQISIQSSWEVLLPDWLFLICNPLSQFKTILAPGSGLSRRAHCLVPNCSSCGSSFQVGRGGGLGPGFSQHTAVAFRRFSGHRRANMKVAKKMERT